MVIYEGRFKSKLHYSCGMQEQFWSHMELLSACSSSGVKFLHFPLDRFVSYTPANMKTPLTLIADYEVHTVIRFLTAKNRNTIEIHRELCEKLWRKK